MKICFGGLTKHLKKNIPSTVLIIKRSGGIGDLLMLSPALEELKLQFPKIVLDLSFDYSIPNYLETASNWDVLNDVKNYQTLSLDGYDFVIDVTSACIQYESSLFPPINRIDLYASFLGLDSLASSKPTYIINKTYSDKLAGLPKPYIGLHISSSDVKRDWPTQYYGELIQSVSDELKCTFVLLDYKSILNKEDFPPNVIRPKNLELMELASIINQLDLLVCPDSGPMHLAGALDTPCIALFGSTLPAARINHYEGHRALQTDSLDCLGCWYSECDKNFECMKALNSDMVKSMILEVLNEDMFRFR